MSSCVASRGLSDLTQVKMSKQLSLPRKLLLVNSISAVHIAESTSQAYHF